MSDFLDRLAFAAVQGTLALAVVAAVTLIFRNLSPNVRAWLWRLAFLRFLVALAFEWSAPVLPPAPVPMAPDFATTAALSVATGVPLLEVVPAPPVPPATDSSGLWLSIWAVPAALLFGVGLVRYARIRSIAHRAVPVRTDVRASDRVQVPCLVGLWRGLILLPTVLLHPSRAEECAMAVAHETAHRDRRDPLFGLVHFLVACAFWFVVPVWFALREYAVQVEMDCDQRALRSTRLSARRYGGMLVAFATQDTFPVGAHSMGGSRSGLKRRLLAMKQPLTPPSIATLALAGLLGALLLVPVRPVEASPKPARAPAPASVPATSGDLSVELREVQKQLNAARATLAKTPARTAKARAERKKVETQLRSAQQRLDSARAILRRTVAPRAVRPASPTRVRSVIDTRPLSASDARFLAEASALAASSLAEVASTGLDGSHGMGSAALGMDGSHNIVTTEVALDGAHQLRPSVPILRDVPLVDVRNRAMPPAVPAQESRLLQLDPTVEKELARMMQEVRGLKLDPAAQKALEQAMQEVRRHKVAAQAQEQMAKALAELRMREARYGGVRPAAAGQGTGRFTSPGIALPPGKTGAFGSRFEGGSPGGPVEGEFLAPVPPRAEWFREVRAPGVLRVQSGSAVRTRIDRTVEIANDRIVVVVGGKRHLITIPKGQDRVVAHGVVITRKKMADGKSAYQIEIRR